MLKLHSMLVGALAVLSMNAHALEPKVEIFEQYDNLRVVAFINEKDIDDSPAWSPDMVPPLTLSEATQAVRKFNKNGAVKEIEIRQMPSHEEKWHYLVKVLDDDMRSKFDVYVVLMNGKVIPAIIEPQAYK